jgi:DNA-binding CsgD family transcriptional regulator
VGILIVVVVQKNKLSRMHRKLQESNDSLNVLSHKLADANTHLNEVNNELVENNYIKENYVAHFIRLSSEYIGKNQKFRLEVNKALRKGKVEDALRMTLYAGTDDEELEEFYANFDEAFLSIFPHFIEEYNKLMAEENRVVLTDKQKERKMLTSELRVFALIRLGFNDSATIARMLRYSINTIYNIRSKVKNKAIVSKDSFESLIMKIGMLSME